MKNMSKNFRRTLAGVMFCLIPMVCQAAPFAYIPNSGDGTVSVIDTATNAIIGSPITVGAAPKGVAVNSAGTRVYIANEGSNTVSVIDTSTNTVVGSIPVATPFVLAVNPAGTRVYVANRSNNTVFVIDAATNTVVGSPITVGTNPWGIAVNPAGTRVYVANRGDGTVSVIDAATNTVIGSAISVGSGPIGLAVAPDGAHVHVGNFDDGTVSVIDATTNTVVGSPFAVGNYPVGLALNPPGTRLYVANEFSTNTVSVIDTSTNTVVGTPIAVGSYPTGLAVNPAGTRVYVANNGSNNVSVIDTATNTVISSISVGSGPVALGRFIGPEICTPPPSGLVSWWGGDNNALDIVGTNNGTLMNGATFAPGKVGQAFSFDGASFVEVPGDIGSFGSESFTVDFWMNSNTDGSNTFILGKNNANGGLGWDIRLSGNTIQVVGVNGWDFNITSDASVTADSWHHIALSSTESLVSLYVDGVLKGTSGRSTISTTSNPFRMGFTTDYEGSDISGQLDEVEVFNRALSADEIAAIYNAGSAGQCPVRHVLTVTPSGTGSGSVTGNGLNCLWNGSNSSGTCSVTLNHKTAVSLTASPSVGSTFDGWSGGSGSAAGCIGTGACSFSVTQASGVGSPFTLNTYNLAVTPSGTGSGSVTGNGLNCSWNGSSSSGTCSVTLNHNSAVSLTATPSVGSTFSGWSGGSGSASGCSGTGPCSFNITQASGVGAPFTPNTYNLAVTPSGTGSGSVTGNGLNCSWNGSSSSGTCSVTLNHNSAVSLTAIPSVGSTFSGWSGGSGSAASCSGTGACSFSITQASGVGSPFTLNTYRVTANAQGNGVGRVQSNVGGVSYNYPAGNTGTTSALNHGTNAVLTATAVAGSTVAWTTCTGTTSGNGTGQSTCTYASLDGNKTAAATFTLLNTYNMTVTPSGTGSGSVTGNGIDCLWNGSGSSGTCSVTLNHNTAVSLTATPSAGSAFSGWSGGSGSAAGCSGTGTCAFNMTEVSGIGSIFARKSSIYLPLILRL